MAITIVWFFEVLDQKGKLLGWVQVEIFRAHNGEKGILGVEEVCFRTEQIVSDCAKFVQKPYLLPCKQRLQNGLDKLF